MYKSNQEPGRTNKEISFLKNRAISIYKLSRTEYKQLAHF